jgi:hypothetical protein
MAASHDLSPEKIDTDNKKGLIQINRFSEEQNIKFTSIIKRFILNSSQINNLSHGQPTVQ